MLERAAIGSRRKSTQSAETGLRPKTGGWTQPGTARILDQWTSSSSERLLTSKRLPRDEESVLSRGFDACMARATDGR
jgi:hypothetical protein